jgi:hypothetical protein
VLASSAGIPDHTVENLVIVGDAIAFIRAKAV